MSPTATALAEEAPKKILVLPYQAIYRSVPQKKLDNATELLQKELGQINGLSILKAATGGQATATHLSIEKARQAIDEARTLEAQKEIGAAVEAWKRAISEFEQNASAIEEADEYILAHHHLARAQLMNAQDADAKTTIGAAARMSPSFDLPRGDFSRLYRHYFREAAEKALKEARAKILVKSSFPGANVSLDGRALEVAPVMLEQIVPGKHLLSAHIEGLPPFATIVTVSAGQQTEVTATYANATGGSFVGQVTDAVARNEIPDAAVKSAVSAGKEAGAEYVLIGAMAKDEDKFRVHTFVVGVEAAKIAPLSAISFDLEMLTAESDVLRIAQATHDIVRAFKSGQNAIAKVESRLREQSTINRINASPELMVAKRKVGAAKEETEKRAVFRPLKGGTIVIKDEEE